MDGVGAELGRREGVRVGGVERGGEMPLVVGRVDGVDLARHLPTASGLALRRVKREKVLALLYAQTKVRLSGLPGCPGQ